jgi:hypothetical protein
VNVIDAIGIQADTETWLNESEWTESGASCLTRERYTGLTLLSPDELLAIGGVPPCALDLVSLTCGARSHFATGAVLMSEVPLTVHLGLF